GGNFFQNFGKFHRSLEGFPSFPAAQLVFGNAQPHFLVIGLRRRDIGPWGGMRSNELFGVGALAGTCAANNEGQAASHCSFSETRRLHSRDYRNASLHDKARWQLHRLRQVTPGNYGAHGRKTAERSEYRSDPEENQYH